MRKLTEWKHLKLKLDDISKEAMNVLHSTQIMSLLFYLFQFYAIYFCSWKSLKMCNPCFLELSVLRYKWCSSASYFYCHPLYVLLLWSCWASLHKRLKLDQLFLLLSLTYISNWANSCFYPFSYLCLAFYPVCTSQTFHLCQPRNSPQHLHTL